MMGPVHAFDENSRAKRAWSTALSTTSGLTAVEGGGEWTRKQTQNKEDGGNIEAWNGEIKGWNRTHMTSRARVEDEK